MISHEFSDIEHILSPCSAAKSTKLVCTIGPACANVKTLKEMVVAGMNIARLNFSHGSHESNSKTIDLLNKVRDELQIPFAIMLDTKGIEIRTGFLESHKPVQLSEGDYIEMTTDYSFHGNSKRIACNYAHLCDTVKPTDVILCSDGTISFEVVEIKSPTEVLVKVLTDCVLNECQNMNIPHSKIHLDTITAKDKEDILAFETRVDMLAISFVQEHSDFNNVKELLSPDSSVKVIAKIENREGLRNFKRIQESFDGVMIARGDMGMEVSLKKVPLIQKSIIQQCNRSGKFVIVATQMLESMKNNPRPTRAEASDVMNAVFDGTDAVMVSGETASGSHPLIAVHTLAELCKQAESALDNKVLSDRYQHCSHDVAKDIVDHCFSKAIEGIVIFEDTELCKEVSKLKPHCPIFWLTCSTEVLKTEARILNGMFKGVTCLYLPATDASIIAKDIKGVLEQQNIGNGAVIVANSGLEPEQDKFTLLELA